MSSTELPWLYKISRLSAQASSVDLFKGAIVKSMFRSPVHQLYLCNIVSLLCFDVYCDNSLTNKHKETYNPSSGLLCLYIFTKFRIHFRTRQYKLITQGLINIRAVRIATIASYSSSSHNNNERLSEMVSHSQHSQC